MERKKLLTSQKELLRMKREKINEAIMLMRQREAEFDATLNKIAEELDVPEEDFANWKLSKNDDYLEEKSKKEIKKTTVKGKKKRR